MLTVLTWLWAQKNGRASYSAMNVNIWAHMVARHLAMPHRIACVTDMPEGIDPAVTIIKPPGDFEGIRLQNWSPERGKPQCLRRIAMFAPHAGAIFGPRFVAMDLDCVIAGPLDPLFSHGDDFRMFRGTGKNRPYNGSMIQMTAGARPQVYTQLTPQRAQFASRRYLGSDQAWIAQCLGPGEETWGAEHGVYWNEGKPPPADTAIMFYPGRVKPWSRPDPWIDEHYRLPSGKTALIVGYKRSAAQAIRDALASHQWDGVIGIGPVGELLGFEPTVSVETRDEAYAMARRLGFDNLTVVGA